VGGEICGIFEGRGIAKTAKTAKTPGVGGFGSFGGWLMGYFCRVRREISERRISPNPPKPRSSSFGGFGSASIVR